MFKKELNENLRNYNGKEKIKLNINSEVLSGLIFENQRNGDEWYKAIDTNLERSILKDTKIYGSLENCIINNTNFKGSKCAIMSYEQYCEDSRNNDLTDVRIDYEYIETLEEINKVFQKVKR